MKDMSEWLKIAHADIVAAQLAVTILIAMMVLDVIFGLGVAYTKREVNSSASWHGITKKVGMLGIVALMSAMDPFVPEHTIAQYTAMAYCVTEAISIVENAGQLGVPIPGVVRRFMKVFEEAFDTDGDENGNEHSPKNKRSNR